VLLAWYGGAWSSSEALSDLQPPPPAVQAGERWQFSVRLKAPHGSLNPHGFDTELWLWEQGLQATGYVRAGPKDLAPVRLGLTGRHPVEWVRQQVRDAIWERGQHKPGAGQPYGVVAALAVGDQRAIDRANWDVFRLTGVAHLMSISGLHITMLAWLSAALWGWLWRRSARACLWLSAPVAAAWGGCAVAVAYALLSGWGLPAQRTVCMLVTWTLLQALGRRWPWTAQWSLACAAVVAWDPWALVQAGFWLSFVAVGVLMATGQSAAEQLLPPTLLQRARQLWREQWVVTLALTPMSVLWFGQVSWVGLLANLLAIPWVTLVVTPLSLAGTVWPFCWDLSAQAIQALLAVLQTLASWPWAFSYLPHVPLWVALAGMAGGLLLVLRLPWSMRGAGLPLLLPLFWWQVPLPAPGQFELIAADIGQGTAVLVRTARHALLYDAGPRYGRDSDAGQRTLVPLLRALDVKLDRLVLSHRDTDHVGGAQAVLLAHPKADVLSSLEDGHELLRMVSDRPMARCSAGQQWAWDGVHFEILHPQEQDYGRIKTSNGLSCVLRIQTIPSEFNRHEEPRSALLTGDIEKPQERQLLHSGVLLQSDLLLVPKPKWAVVQAGYRNRYGHPAPEVMQRYSDLAVPVLVSTTCGALIWASDASPRCTRDEQRRYWHH
jgi:competence protein ComEC